MTTQHGNTSGDGSEGHWIFRAWKIDPKTGEKMYAKHYGMRGWPIWISNDSVPPSSI